MGNTRISILINWASGTGSTNIPTKLLEYFLDFIANLSNDIFTFSILELILG